MRMFLSESTNKMPEQFNQLSSIYDIFKDSDRLTPIIFSLVGGGDAAPIILDLHEKLGFADRLNILTLGKDQVRWNYCVPRYNIQSLSGVSIVEIAISIFMRGRM